MEAVLREEVPEVVMEPDEEPEEVDEPDAELLLPVMVMLPELEEPVAEEEPVEEPVRVAVPEEEAVS